MFAIEMADHPTAADELGRLEDQAGVGLMSDPYLADVAGRYPTHAFLGGSTQLIYQRQIRFLVELARVQLNRPPAHVHVLDWGCGKGHISYLLRRAGFRLTACDVDAHADDSAFGQVTPIIDEQAINVVPLLDAIGLPFGDATFDIALSVGVLEHVADDAGSLRELRRVLKPEGLCVVTFLPYTLSWTQRLAHARGDRYHDHLYSRAGVSRLAAGAGFRVLRMTHGQLFPKNTVSLRAAGLLEPLDRALCRYTPLRYFATNLEVVLVAE